MQFTTRVLIKPSYLFIRKLLVVFIFVFVGSNVFTQPTNNLVGDVVMPSPTAASLGKYTDIPVSHFTGVPSISVPIFAVQDGSLSLPISLSYHASGIKVGEPASRVGMGWSLNAGGVISRTVLGLADESPGGYFESGGTSPPNLADLIQVKNGQKDSEPDIFSFNFAGYSGKFFFDANGNYQHVTKSDIHIEKIEANNSNNTLSGFIVTTPDGNKYYFGYYSNSGTSKSAVEITGQNGYPGYYGEEYVSLWYLLRVENHDASFYIDLNYTDEEYSYKSMSSCTYESETLTWDFITQDWLQGLCSGTSGGNGVSCSVGDYTIVPIRGERLTSIVSPKYTVNFYSNTNRLDLEPYQGSSAKRLDKIEIQSGTLLCKQFNFTYNYFTDNTISGGGPDYKRLKLESIQEASCDGSISNLPNPYVFTYEGNFIANRMTKAIDHWGYYNGALNNNSIYNPVNCPPTTITYPQGGTLSYGTANRDTDFAEMLKGALTKIDYPTGGYLEIEYEANTAYLDPEDAVGNGIVFNDFVTSAMTLFGNYDKIIDLTNCGSPLAGNGECCGETSATSSAVSFTSGQLALGKIEMSMEYVNSFFGPSDDTCFLQNLPSYELIIEDVSSGTTVETFFFYLDIPNGEKVETVSMLLSEFDNLQADTDYYFTIEVSDAKADLEVYVPVAGNVEVGGLRAKSLTLHDGISSANDIVKTFEYTLDDPEQSSGVLYSIPTYGESFQNSGGSLSIIGTWFRASSIVPLGSFEGYHVGYKRVLEKQNGNGYVEHNFFTEVRNTSVDFPMPPDPPTVLNGKLSQQSYYNESGIEVKKIENTPHSSDQKTIAPGYAYKLFYRDVDCSPYSNTTQALFKVTSYPLTTTYYRLKESIKYLDGVKAVSNLRTG